MGVKEAQELQELLEQQGLAQLEILGRKELLDLLGLQE
jgi:hypothetical protein